MAELRSRIKGVLFDLDGVLYVGDEVIPGAIDALDELDLPCRFITNTSTRTVEEVAARLGELGFSIPAADVFSAVSATRAYLARQGRPRVDLLIRESTRAEFAAFEQTTNHPDYVVVGDIGATWNYGLLNRVFNELMDGAELLAMHKNKYWQTGEGLRMDIGAFVAGLEFVSGRPATVVGKPSEDFFRLAVDSMGLSPQEVMIVGDDIENDVGGGQAIGLYGVLVRTGKYREAVAEASAVRPDMVIDSIADLSALLRD